MTNEEKAVAEEFDRRLNEIFDLFEEETKAPIQAFQVATKRKQAARKELDAWYAENYRGLKEVSR